MYASMKNASVFLNGVAAGIPIGLGYLAVAFSLGIVARNAGLSPWQGFLASFLNLASAGEYALFSAISNSAALAEIALVTFVVNARYLLMSCALSQRFGGGTAFPHRLLVAFGITDELFGVAVSRTGRLNPAFSYGAMLVAVPLWSAGTALGVAAGNVLPKPAVDALSVALYGMFLAIVVPPARKSLPIACAVVAGAALSWLCSVAPLVSSLSSGTRTIVLTVAVSAVLALVRPLPDGGDRAEGGAE